MPRVLIHPSLKRLVAMGTVDSLYFDGEIRPLYSRNFNYSYILKKYWDIYKTYPDSRELNKHYYAFNSKDGDIYPLFFYAPCNKCYECSVTRYAEFASRLQLECASYPLHYRPIFFTLTYDNEHLPKDKSVSRSDITEFINKLNINLHRCGIMDTARVFLASEYGTDPRFTRRPHYHGIVFALDTTAVYFARNFNIAFHRSWMKCRYERAVWEFARSPHALSRYVTKYVIKGLKEDFVPDGCKPNFISVPRQGGGLGSPCLKNPEILKSILESKDGTVSFKSMSYASSEYNSSVHQGITRIRIPKFIINKLWPSFSRFFTKNISRCLDFLTKSYRSISHHERLNLPPIVPILTKFKLLYSANPDLSAPILGDPEPLGHRYWKEWAHIDESKLLKLYKSIYSYLESYKFDSTFVAYAQRARESIQSRFHKFSWDFDFSRRRFDASRFEQKLCSESLLDWLS